MDRTRLLAACAAVAAALAIPSCGGGGSSPNPTPSTTVNPAPSPTPTPTPPPPAAANCQYGLGDATATCAPDTDTYLDAVSEAIDTLAHEHPEVLDFNDQQGGGGYRIISVGRYYLGVIENLEAMGLCAQFDGEELGVRGEPNFSDHFDIETGNGYARRGPASYRGTCHPASIPQPVTIPGPVPGCTIGGSKEVACGRESSTLLPDVNAAIDQLVEAQPNLFDVNDTHGGDDWYKVVDVQGYIQGMIDTLTTDGFCATYDGEELNVKRTNDLSENFDILTGDEYIRRGEGSYRGTCYPAGF